MTVSWIKTQWILFATAVTFLTRLPVPSGEYNADALGKSVLYFPIVGLLVGSLGAVVFAVANAFWTVPIAILLMMVATMLITGGFHEDGLADTVDGLGGGWTLEDKLRIMKDSRLGTYGALALVMTLLLKLWALMAVPVYAIPGALICGHVLGRWAILPLLRYCDYLGGEQGAGGDFIGAVDGRRLLLGTLPAWILVAVCAPAKPFAMVLVSIVLIALCRQVFLGKLGGITGDTLGASNQLVELAVYLLLASHFS